jgi:hypothetical protein
VGKRKGALRDWIVGLLAKKPARLVTMALANQEQPAGCHLRKARVADRDPGRRTASGPADICSAPTEAGHMTAANQIVRSAKKVLAMEGRPHMTTFAPILINFSFRRRRLRRTGLRVLRLDFDRRLILEFHESRTKLEA